MLHAGKFGPLDLDEIDDPRHRARAPLREWHARWRRSAGCRSPNVGRSMTPYRSFGLLADLGDEGVGSARRRPGVSSSWFAAGGLERGVQSARPAVAAGRAAGGDAVRRKSASGAPSCFSGHSAGVSRSGPLGRHGPHIAGDGLTGASAPGPSPVPARATVVSAQTAADEVGDGDAGMGANET